ncbi:MAG: Uma2 family endonuclease [Anaerolineae bacterium]|nr:Uma2 family endonuclease [Anaerolineae bacterium]
MIGQTRTRMTSAEFLTLPESNEPRELIEGEVILSPAPIPQHQRCSRRLLITLDSLIPHGEVFDAPIDLLLDGENVLQPDLVWVAEGGRCIITDKLLRGAPELVVEILSPGSTRLDRDTKFTVYERHGVREYWIVDPIEAYLEVYVQQDGRFVRQGTYGAEDTVVSSALGGAAVDLKRVFGA